MRAACARSVPIVQQVVRVGTTTGTRLRRRRGSDMLNRRKAMIGWLVYSAAKPVAKRAVKVQAKKSTEKSTSSTKSKGHVGRTVPRGSARLAAIVGGVLFWNHRRSNDDETARRPDRPRRRHLPGPGSPAARSRAISPRTGATSSSATAAASAPARPAATAAFSFASRPSWINDLLAESAEIYDGARRPHRAALRLPAAAAAPARRRGGRARARPRVRRGVGGEEHDTNADPWLADDLAGGFLVEGGYMLDPLGATTAMAEAARARRRRLPARLRGEAGARERRTA